MRHEIIDASQFELQDKVVTIKRVTKVVKGGRNMRFTALVVVGCLLYTSLSLYYFLRSLQLHLPESRLAFFLYVTCPYLLT